MGVKSGKAGGQPAANSIENPLPPLEMSSYLDSGLDATQVKDRADLGFSNQQNLSSSRSAAHIIRSNTLTLFNAVIAIAFLLVLSTGNWRDALFGIPAMLNLVLGIGQELRSKRALDRLSIVSASGARVKRSGQLVEIPGADIVLDDFLEIRAGDQILVDAIVLEAEYLTVDESLVSGESEPVDKFQGDELVSGSIVLTGLAKVRAIRVGANSTSGRISLEAKRFSLVSSEIRNSLNRIILVISILLLPVTAIASYGQIQAFGGWDLFVSTARANEVLVAIVASVVSMVPQGLVLLASITFAIAAIRLANKKVLVQELPAVETLSRVDVICFDKTGTLTTGDLAVQSITELNKSVQLNVEWTKVLEHFARDPEANLTAKAIGASLKESEPLSIIQKIPFDSAKKYSGYTIRSDSGLEETWILGAPEIVIDEVQFPEDFNSAQLLAAAGYRVLVLASTPTKLSELNVESSQLTPKVLISLVEQIRGDAKQTLEYFAGQGVSVRIISGDNPKTVAAVAKLAGLQNFTKSGLEQVTDGNALPENLEDLAAVLEENFVFGRVNPEQKRQMIKALQLKGHVVAMTGDGVNDALALKQADLGIAMGSGSPATKAVAKLVLVGGQFSAIPQVVAEGRKVIANMERVSSLFLTKTVWAAILAITFGLLSWRFAYTPRQITALDIYIIGLPSFALALLPNARRYRKGFLKRTLALSIPAGSLMAILVLSQFYLMSAFQLQSTAGGVSSQSSVIILLSILSLWVVLILSRPLDLTRVLIVLTCIGIFASVFVIPFLNEFLGFVALSLNELLVSAALGLVGILGLEVIARSKRFNQG